MLHEKQRALTIGQAAEELGVSCSWLRFGEGWRYYTPEDIDRLRRLGVGERKRRLAGSHE